MSMASLFLSFSSSHSSSLPQSYRATSLPAKFRHGRSQFSVPAKIHEILMPKLSATMTEGKVVSWIKSEGDVLSKNESVLVVQSDKADMEVETFDASILVAIVVPEGESMAVRNLIAVLAEIEEEIEDAKAIAARRHYKGAQNTELDLRHRKLIVTTPHVRRLAKKHKVNINLIKGTGRFENITPADVEAAAGIAPKQTVAPLAAADPAVAAAPTSVAAPPPLPGSIIVPFTTMQAAVSKNMVESLSVPTFRVGFPVITDALDAFYEKVKPKGVTMTAILAKAAAMALAQHPVVNAVCKDAKSFSYNSSINVAVAVAIDGGLIIDVSKLV